jgi:hypothetical protein
MKKTRDKENIQLQKLKGRDAGRYTTAYTSMYTGL